MNRTTNKPDLGWSFLLCPDATVRDFEREEARFGGVGDAAYAQAYQVVKAKYGIVDLSYEARLGNKRG
jgi:hypothetical protein